MIAAGPIGTVIMASQKGSKRSTAAGSRIRRARVADGAIRDSLGGLRDALDLTLTRVIEDEMGVDEAREVLRYLEKELDGLKKRSRRGKRPARKTRRRSTAARKA